MSHNSPQVEVFRAELHALGVDFICYSALPDLCVTVHFLGVFKGEAVLWQMTLGTSQYWMSQNSKIASVESADLFKTPFIEIAAGEKGVCQLKVGLKLDFIDESVIKKSIIMIRNYKKLAIGRSGFGNMYT